MARNGLLILTLIGLSGSPASAQDVLGTGRGLESRLEITAPTDRAAPARQFMAEMRLRNAIVTGNVPGGMAFRGDVGYGAPGEFRAELGSNDLFPFRRDSYYSGLAGYGIRGTEAIQYQFALTTGSRAQGSLIGSPLVYRDGGGFSPVDLAPGSGFELPDGATPPTQVPGSGLYRIDPATLEESDPLNAGLMLGTLRSTSAYVTSRAYQPTVLGVGEAQTGERFGLTASGLMGVHVTELSPRTRGNDRPAQPGQVTPTDATARIEPALTSHDALIERLLSRTGPGQPTTTSTLADIEEQIRAIRMGLVDLTEQPDEPAFPIVVPEVNPFVVELEDVEDLGPDTPAVPLPPGLTPEAAEFLREISKGEVDRFIIRASPADPFAEHVRRGQELITQGRYFDAEERFTRALASRPGDVASMTGRVHAQIGAGMYLSAATNLRELLSVHPEVVAARYAPNLLPSRERLRQVIAQLEANVAVLDRNADSRLGRESALLLAYLGHQQRDRAMIERGLEAIRGSPVVADKTLHALLRSIWLEGDAPAPDEGD